VSLAEYSSYIAWYPAGAGAGSGAGAGAGAGSGSGAGAGADGSAVSTSSTTSFLGAGSLLELQPASSSAATAVIVARVLIFVLVAIICVAGAQRIPLLLRHVRVLFDGHVFVGIVPQTLAVNRQPIGRCVSKLCSTSIEFEHNAHSGAPCATCGGTLNHPSRISLKVDRSVFTRPNLPRALPSIVGARKLRCEVCFSFLKTLAPAGRNPSGSGPPH